MKTVDAMRMMIALGLLIVSVAAVGQQTPAPPQSQSILIEGATAHLGTGDVIESCAIGLKDGRIDYVGRSFQVNKDEYDVVIDGRGQHVYPGFIVLNTTLG
ncbi:MAG TPA: amidohydrolase, partial [Flavobacteriales bacterium]|nr:amidohydrolase [Flavobacteriales bacterium]